MVLVLFVLVALAAWAARMAPAVARACVGGGGVGRAGVAAVGGRRARCICVWWLVAVVVVVAAAVALALTAAAVCVRGLVGGRGVCVCSGMMGRARAA